MEGYNKIFFQVLEIFKYRMLQYNTVKALQGVFYWAINTCLEWLKAPKACINGTIKYNVVSSCYIYA